MLDLALVVGGVLLIIVVFADALSTTLVVADGPGPVTRRVTGLLWRTLLRLHRRDSRSSILTFAGPALLVLTVLVWVTGLWTGWTLLFLSDQGTVVDSRTQAPAGVVDLVYFTGFTVFTLGTGDFVAATAGWRLTSAVASFTGLFLVTLAITFLISVVSAVVSRRSLAVAVHGLGASADDIVLRGWDGTAFTSGFVQHLVNLGEQVAAVAQHHLAYPVLHYFHAREREASAPAALAELEDALLLLVAGVAPSARPSAATVEPLRYVIERYVTTAAATGSLPRCASPPPAAPLQRIADGGVPVAAADEFRAVVSQEAGRRTALLRLVNGDGWSWPDRGR